MTIEHIAHVVKNACLDFSERVHLEDDQARYIAEAVIREQQRGMSSVTVDRMIEPLREWKSARDYVVSAFREWKSARSEKIDINRLAEAEHGLVKALAQYEAACPAPIMPDDAEGRN